MSSTKSEKDSALRRCGSLNAHPERVTDQLFEENAFFDSRDQLQVKYEMLRRVRVDGHTVRSAAERFGFSRPAYYQTQQVFEREGLAGLLPKKPGPKTAHKLDEQVMMYIEDVLAQEVGKTPAQLVEMLEEQFGLRVHPRSIERALQRAEKKKRQWP